MQYFIRTEESMEDAQLALQRGRSIRRWAYAGCTPWEHLAFAIPADEQLNALRGQGDEDIAEIFELGHIYSYGHYGEL